MEIISRYTEADAPDPDKIGGANEVELTPIEEACLARRNCAMSSGASVMDASKTALAGMIPSMRSNEFVLWLSDRTLRMTRDKRIAVVGEHRSTRPIIRADEVPLMEGRAHA